MTERAQLTRTRVSHSHGGRDWYVRVSRGGDEVEAAVDASVGDPFLPGDVDLLLQELLVLFIDVLLNGLPAGGGGVDGKKADGCPRKKGLLATLPQGPMDSFPC